MPSKIDLYQIGVWFCVGFFTGAGWAIAGWLVGAYLSSPLWCDRRLKPGDFGLQQTGRTAERRDCHLRRSNHSGGEPTKFRADFG